MENLVGLPRIMLQEFLQVAGGLVQVEDKGMMNLLHGIYRWLADRRYLWLESWNISLCSSINSRLC
jgi:hypothetical protein